MTSTDLVTAAVVATPANADQELSTFMLVMLLGSWPVLALGGFLILQRRLDDATTPTDNRQASKEWIADRHTKTHTVRRTSSKPITYGLYAAVAVVLPLLALCTIWTNLH